MPRLSPVSPKKQVTAFKKLGFRESGQVGSHLKLSKRGRRPVIIPTNKKEVEVRDSQYSSSLRSPSMGLSPFFS